MDRSGDLTGAARVPTPAGGAEGLWDALAGLGGSVVATAPDGALVGCGVGCGGPMAPGGEDVSPLNIPAWRGFPLRHRLAELTGLRLDPYFSGTKLIWLAEHEPHTWALVQEGRYAVGTVDSYLIARMTRGTWISAVGVRTQSSSSWRKLRARNSLSSAQVWKS